MNKMEAVEFTDRMKALDAEERKLALQMFPTGELFDELIRRQTATENKLREVREIIK